LLTSGAAETLIATAKQVAETLRVKLDLPLVRKWGSNGEEIRFVGRKVVVSVDPEFGAETTLVIDWTPGEPVRPEKPKKDPWEPLFKQVLLNTIGRAGSDQRPYSDGPVVRAVDIDVVRMDYYRHVLEDSPGTKQDTRRKAFARAMEKARKGGLVQFCEIDERQYVWVTDPAMAPGHAPRTGPS
jgi:hypothetical protein